MRDGSEKTYVQDDIAKLDAHKASILILCETAGLGFSALRLAKIADAGAVRKFGLDLHAYRVILGSDATRTIANVRLWPGHLHLPIETIVNDGSRTVKVEYAQFDGVMAHQ